MQTDPGGGVLDGRSRDQKEVWGVPGPQAEHWERQLPPEEMALGSRGKG